MRTKGLAAEELACGYLQKHGMQIMARNYHSRFGEIDIICRDNDTLVFVEVKMRTSSAFGTPLEAITYAKLSKMQKTAYFFMSQYHLGNCPFRFDAIEVDGADPDHPDIRHVENITL